MLNIYKKYSYKLLYSVLFILFACINIFILKNLYQAPVTKIRLLITFISIALVFVIIGWLYTVAKKHHKTGWFVLALLIFAFAIRITWIINAHTLPVSDFIRCFETAKVLVHSGPSVMRTYAFKHVYFQMNPYQIPFVLYDAAIMKIFGSTMFAVQAFNSFISTMNIFIVYLITKKIFNPEAAIFTAMLYTLDLGNIIFSSVMSNQFITMFFIYLAIYLFITKNKWYWGIVIGFILAIGNTIRPIAIIALIAIIAFALLYHTVGQNKSTIISLVIVSLTIGLSYFATNLVANKAVVATGVSEYELINREPNWKYILGFNQKTVGSYSWSDRFAANEHPLGPKRDAFERKLLKQRLEDKPAVAKLFVKKFNKLWGGVGDEYSWSFGYRQKKYANSVSQANKNWLQYSTYVNYFLVIFLATIGFALAIKKINIALPKYTVIFSVLLAGFALAHLVLEIQTRYRFEVMPIFFMFAGLTIFTIKEKLSHAKK